MRPEEEVLSRELLYLKAKKINWDWNDSLSEDWDRHLPGREWEQRHFKSHHLLSSTSGEGGERETQKAPSGRRKIHPGQAQTPTPPSEFPDVKVRLDLGYLPKSCLS